MKMSSQETETLIFILSCDRLLTPEEIGVAFDFDGSLRTQDTKAAHGVKLTRPLLNAGALYRVRKPSRYGLTEKGRIAAALSLAQQPDLMVAYFDEVPS